jgi:hypothetical protein
MSTTTSSISSSSNVSSITESSSIIPLGYVSFNNINYKLNTIIPINKLIQNYNSMVNIKKIINSPLTLDLTPYLNPIRDQGLNGNSVAYSVALIVEYQLNILKNNKKLDTYLSPSYIYNLVNVNAINCNNGIDVPNALDILTKYGIPTENIFPTPDSCVIQIKEIPQLAHIDASNNRIVTYIELYTIDQIKSCLTNFGPCIININVYNNSPTFWIKNKNDTSLGVHTLNIVGYDENSFILRNSWGSTWAKNGYTNLPFDDYSFILNTYSAVTMDGTLVFPKIKKILLKSSTPVKDVVDIQINNNGCINNNRNINMLPIYIVLGLLGALLLGILIYYIFVRKIYKENFKYVFKYYAVPLCILIIFTILVSNTTIMGVLNGLDITFILNLCSICFLVLPIIITFFYNIYAKENFNLASIISNDV